MKNLKSLATDLVANNMTILVATDMLNIRGGCGCISHGTNKVKSAKKGKSFKSGGSGRKGGGSGKKGGYGCGGSTWAYVG